MRSILQSWVAELGLRHQGVLVSAVRGCDSLPKEHPSKRLTRVLRCDILVAHVGDPRKCVSFIEHVDDATFETRAGDFCASLDELPSHYLLHFAHACEILGYYHPTRAARWLHVYRTIARKLHLTPETKAELDRRLNAGEQEFRAAQ